MTEIVSESRAGPAGYDISPFGVSVRSEDPSAWVIEVRGELDIATGPMLNQSLEPYTRPNGNGRHRRKIVYLLPELKFMDARGLHYLLTAIDEQHGSETITVREPSSQVRRLLELVGMDSIIEQPANR